MFEEISNLIGALYDAGSLRHDKVVNALAAFSQSMDDQDYRCNLIGELSIKLARLGQFDRAEEFARTIDSMEKSEFLRRIAEIEVGNNRTRQALRLLLEAREATYIHRFPTQQAQALAEIALSLETAGHQQEALETWGLAVDMAKKGQDYGGTDGPEAAEVLAKAVEALSRAGKPDAARAVGGAIKFDLLREKALRGIRD